MIRRLSLLSVAHFGVDFACAALYFGRLGDSADWWTILLLYNACAFAMQFPLGILADRWNRNRLFALVGVCAVFASFTLRSAPLLGAILAGLGNGAFHVGAGVEILNASGSRAGPLGVFVSPGAIGLYLGTAYAGLWSAHEWIVLVLLAVCAACVAFSAKGNPLSHSENVPPALPETGKTVLPLLALFAVVVLRSALGTTEAFRAAGVWPIVGVLCVAGGKAAGGYLGDRFGLRPVGGVSLGLCTVLLCIPAGWAHLLALLLFNMSMPLSLHGAAAYWKSAKGASFGLLTLALFLGLIPKLLSTPLPNSVPLYVGLTLASLGLLLFGLREDRV